MGVDLFREHVAARLVASCVPEADGLAARAHRIVDPHITTDDCLQDAWVGWTEVLTLGLLHGWTPLGTDLGDASWSGSYLSNDWQRVTSEDARGLADALQRALGSDEPRLRPVCDGVHALSAEAFELISEPELVDDALALLASEVGRATVARYAMFLAGGSFVIA